MKFSARNQLKGKVKSIKHGPVSTEVVITVAKDVEITSVITETAAKELGLKTGSAVYAVIKASNVILAVD
jgi:molybdate transport system regulatory protein